MRAKRAPNLAAYRDLLMRSTCVERAAQRPALAAYRERAAHRPALPNLAAYRDLLMRVSGQNRGYAARYEEARTEGKQTELKRGIALTKAKSAEN
jgi:hypothetical protein